MATDHLLKNIEKNLALPKGASVVKDRSRLDFYLLKSGLVVLFEFRTYLELKEYLKPKRDRNAKTTHRFSKRVTKICYICLEPFVLNHHLEKLCSDECRAEANRRNQVKFKNNRNKL